MERSLKPEILDELPAEDPDAQASRRDLQRVNVLMNHVGAFAQSLKKFPAPKRWVDLGSGDAIVVLKLVHRLGWRDGELILVDQQNLVSEKTLKEFAQCN